MKLLRLISIVVIGLNYPGINAAALTQWKSITDGLQYTTIYPTPESNRYLLHAFRIDLNRYRLSLVTAKNMNQTSLFVDQLAEGKNPLLAINGGFFTPDLQPLGLRITNGKLLSPLKNTNWWGVLVVQNNHARILAKRAFHFSSDIQFAIQTGPRLIVNGQIPTLRGGMAQRSAIGITRDGKVIITITDNLSLTTAELAAILQKPENQNGLNCFNALNLDGGSSSQLYAHINNFTLHIRSIRPVSDVILVTPLAFPSSMPE